MVRWGVVAGCAAVVAGAAFVTGATAPPPRPLAAVAAIPLDHAGYVIVGVFVVAWVGALAVWRYGHIEEKWSKSPGSLPSR